MMMSFSENEILLYVAGGRFAVLHVVKTCNFTVNVTTECGFHLTLALPTDRRDGIPRSFLERIAAVGHL